MLTLFMLLAAAGGILRLALAWLLKQRWGVSIGMPQAIHPFTRAQYSCTLSVIITHPRVIKSTLRSTIERVWVCKTPTQTPVAPDSRVYVNIMRVLCVFTTGASGRDAHPKPSKYEKFTVSPYHCITVSLYHCITEVIIV